MGQPRPQGSTFGSKSIYWQSLDETVTYVAYRNSKVDTNYSCYIAAELDDDSDPIAYTLDFGELGITVAGVEYYDANVGVTPPRGDEGYARQSNLWKCVSKLFTGEDVVKWAESLPTCLGLA